MEGKRPYIPGLGCGIAVFHSRRRPEAEEDGQESAADSRGVGSTFRDERIGDQAGGERCGYYSQGEERWLSNAFVIYGWPKTGDLQQSGFRISLLGGGGGTTDSLAEGRNGRGTTRFCGGQEAVCPRMKPITGNTLGTSEGENGSKK